MENEIKITQTDVVKDDSSFDIQIATAKQFPRNIRRCVDNMIAIATMDDETAKSCSYSMPRGGKDVTGGSIHLAKIIAQNWGNIRAEARVSKTTQTNIYSEAVAFDLETNTAFKIESTRKIIKANGQRYNEDLISLTGLVTNSIALRNAIFAVVPKSVIDKVYDAAMQKITGDLSDENKLSKSRSKLIQDFKDIYGVSEDEILKLLGLNSVMQIKQEQIKILIGYAQTLKDGEMTVDNMFGRNKENKAPNPFKEEKQNSADFEKEQQEQKVNKNESNSGKLFPPGNKE